MTMTSDKPQPPALKLMVIILESEYTGRLEEFLHENQIRLHYFVDAMGTARSETLKSLGLSGSEKVFCVCATRAKDTDRLFHSVYDRFSLSKPGNGIIYTLPITGISAVILEFLRSEDNERTDMTMENLVKENNDETAYSLVLSIINHGCSELLMNAARSAGVRGGTIINARHSGDDEAVKFFGVTLQAEKEIVAIVVPNEQKAELTKAISQKCGLHTEAHGIVITLPVESCAGIEQK